MRTAFLRKALVALLVASAGLGGLVASTEPASAWARWHPYRWYRDYAPLYPRAYYGPPVVYVMPPAYRTYPAPLYSYDCCTGYVYGPQGSYYPRAQRYPRQRYYQYYYPAPRRHWR